MTPLMFPYPPPFTATVDSVPPTANDTLLSLSLIEVEYWVVAQGVERLQSLC